MDLGEHFYMLHQLHVIQLPKTIFSWIYESSYYNLLIVKRFLMPFYLFPKNVASAPV